MQAVAKLSADNVVLMVRLRKAEERAGTLDKEVTELRAAVASQSGGWFEDIRAEVQQRIEGSMQHAKELQQQIEDDKSTHAKQLAAVREEKEELGAHLSSALQSCQQLETELQQSQCAPSPLA